MKNIRSMSPEEFDDWKLDRLNDEGHDKDCDKWLSMFLQCSCSARNRGMEPSHDRYADWEDENPTRTPKGAKPKMGRDGDSVKLLSKIIGKGKKK